MQIKYTEAAQEQKNKLLENYPNFSTSIESLENVILKNPNRVLSKQKLPNSDKVLYYRSGHIKLMTNVSVLNKLWLYFYIENDNIYICLVVYQKDSI